MNPWANIINLFRWCTPKGWLSLRTNEIKLLMLTVSVSDESDQRLGHDRTDCKYRWVTLLNSELLRIFQRVQVPFFHSEMQQRYLSQ